MPNVCLAWCSIELRSNYWVKSDKLDYGGHGGHVGLREEEAGDTIGLDETDDRVKTKHVIQHAIKIIGVVRG